MKRVIVAVLLLGCMPAFALMSPDLIRVVSQRDATDLIPIDIVFKEQMDLERLTYAVQGLTRPEKRVKVSQILTAFSAEKQADLLAYLREMEAQGKVTDIKSFWVNNAIYCEATKEVIEVLDKNDKIYYVDYDLKPIDLEKPTYTPAPPDDVNDGGREIAWGVLKIRADSVWTLGYTGQGIVVGDIDTGCNYNHFDLASHMWTDPNYPNHGWNFENDNNDPMDSHGHGTHTCGSVASDGTAGSQCGVAPEAQIMSCRVRTVADSIAENQVWAAMQFVVAPPLSPANGGDLITMSLGWRYAWNPRRATWRTNCDNVGAGGVIMIVAAGNEGGGSPPDNLRCPGDVPPPWWNPQNGATGAPSNVVSIAATDVNDAIASFSSRGPITWQSIPPFNDYAYPPGCTRPDVAAPGVNVKSCLNTSNNGYTTMSGTSMATPHTAGLVALMLSKNYFLTRPEIDSILEVTALDLGAAGKDNDFGAGRIDAVDAINATPPPFSLRPLAHWIDDPAPGGNGNGYWESGEEVNLIVPIFNQQTDTAKTSIATLTTSDTYVTIVSGTDNLGDIAPGDTVDATFVVSASATTPPEHLADFNLNLAHLGGNWDYGLQQYINAMPDLTYQAHAVVGGNGNGILDPGETADLVVTLMNEGARDAENITTILRESSTYITLDDSTGSFGDIPVDSTRDNAADPYTITASPTTPIGTTIDFTIHVTGANNYTADINFTLVVGAPGVDYVTHDCGNVKFTVTRYGALGYMASTGGVGEGFCYPISSATHLYYGSFCAGTDGSYVVDRHYEQNQVDDADWVTTASPDGMIRMYEPGPNNRDEYTTARYDDSGHPSPRGLVCDQFSWAWDDPTANDFVIMKFDMHNEGATAITDLYASIIIDFDIGSMTSNEGSSEAARNLTWMYVSTPYVGVEILDPPRAVPAVNLALIDHATYVYPYSGLPDSVQILFMDGTIQNPSSNRPYDWSTCNSAGPFTIAPGEAAVAAFAILGGDNLTDFQANADTAYNRYWNWPGIKEHTSGVMWTGVRLYPVISFRRPYLLEYAFSRETPLNVKVYDAVGRLVEHKDYGMVNGTGEFSLSLRTYAQGVYFVRVEAAEHTTTKKIIWLR